MNSDFEESLRRQSIRPVPAQWRGEILRAARAQPAASPWWREWLWPHPQAWGALAAAWGIIILLHVAAPGDSAEKGKTALASWQDFAFLRQETEIIALLTDPEESRPAPTPPQPRSSRRVKQAIG
jgi:hypothetical protein